VYERSDEHPAGRIDFVAGLSPGDQFGLWFEGFNRNAYALPFGGPAAPGEGDGHLLFFSSVAQLLPEDQDAFEDFYRYDDETDELTCISCGGDGEFGIVLPFSHPRVFSPIPQSTRVASEDGNAAVFATREAILPEDENTVSDVYVWRDGVLRLATGGTGQVGSAFTEQGGTAHSLISADGKRVFFTTEAALTPSDQNSAFDVYATSVGGGLPLPRPEESKCEDGQSCRGDAPPPPPAADPASASVTGPGNVASKPRRCNRKQVRRKGRCVAKRVLAKRACAKRKGKSRRRCVKKHLRRLDRAQAGQQRPNTDRGGKR
jgi:hypothetical protein